MLPVLCSVFRAARGAGGPTVGSGACGGSTIWAGDFGIGGGGTPGFCGGGGSGFCGDGGSGACGDGGGSACGDGGGGACGDGGGGACGDGGGGACGDGGGGGTTSPAGGDGGVASGGGGAVGGASRDAFAFVPFFAPRPFLLRPEMSVFFLGPDDFANAFKCFSFFFACWAFCACSLSYSCRSSGVMLAIFASKDIFLALSLASFARFISLKYCEFLSTGCEGNPEPRSTGGGGGGTPSSSRPRDAALAAAGLVLACAM